jgi:hypothetical protein
MRNAAIVAIMTLLPGIAPAAKNLTEEDRVELIRGLTAEYATVKSLLPRSRKALEFESDGTWDKKQWSTVAKESGPAARNGDLVQITKVDIEGDRIVLQINGGYKGGKKWYQGVQLSGGMGGAQVPVGGQGNDTNAPGGTSVAIVFHKPLEPIKAIEIKKLLAPVLDFEKRSATQVYSESLPPETQKAIKEKRVLVGMDKDQVIMTLGRAELRSRETKDGMETEDWVYGKPPGKITFVTFSGDKVIKVKDSYAGLGSQVGDQPVVREMRGFSLCLTAGYLLLAGCGGSEKAPPPKAVALPKILQLYAPEPKIGRGEKGRICFGVENTKTVWISPPRQEFAPARERCVDVEPTANTTYTLTAEGQDGTSVSQDVAIAVGSAKVKIANVNVSAVEVKSGETVTICYTVANARAVTIEPAGFRGGPNPKGCATHQPTKSTTYVITATGADGDRDQEQVTVRVR